jgi:hypothetical protein
VLDATVDAVYGNEQQRTNIKVNDEKKRTTETRDSSVITQEKQVDLAELEKAAAEKKARKKKRKKEKRNKDEARPTVKPGQIGKSETSGTLGKRKKHSSDPLLSSAPISSGDGNSWLIESC